MHTFSKNIWKSKYSGGSRLSTPFTTIKTDITTEQFECFDGITFSTTFGIYTNKRQFECNSMLARRSACHSELKPTKDNFIVVLASSGLTFSITFGNNISNKKLLNILLIWRSARHLSLSSSSSPLSTSSLLPQASSAVAALSYVAVPTSSS